MPVKTASFVGQRLPTEVILIIFEHLLDQQPWQLPILTLVSIELRSRLQRRLFEQIHLRSEDQLEAFIETGWPPRSTAYNIELKESQSLALYLRFVIDNWEKEAEFYEEMKAIVEDIAPNIRNQIDTLGLRLIPGHKDDNFMGLWTCSYMPQLRRLYVDTTVMDYSNLMAGNQHSVLTRLSQQCCPDDGNHHHHHSHQHDPKPPVSIFKKPTSLEVYAIGLMSFRDMFAHIPCRRARRYWFRLVFPNLKRLYLFSLDGEEVKTEVEEDLLAVDVDSQTNIEFMVYISMQSSDGKSSCPREGSIAAYPNGTMVFKDIVVNEPRNQLLSLMHRVVDDFESDWAPESFTGKRWSPLTRPRYLRAIPSRQTFERSGRSIPIRISPGPIDSYTT